MELAPAAIHSATAVWRRSWGRSGASPAARTAGSHTLMRKCEVRSTPPFSARQHVRVGRADSPQVGGQLHHGSRQPDGAPVGAGLGWAGIDLASDPDGRQLGASDEEQAIGGGVAGRVAGGLAHGYGLLAASTQWLHIRPIAGQDLDPSLESFECVWASPRPLDRPPDGDPARRS